MKEWYLTPKQWITWLASTFLGGAMIVGGLTTFVYANFTTKDVTAVSNKYFIKRLDRIEDKQDDMLKHNGIKYIPRREYEQKAYLDK